MTKLNKTVRFDVVEESEENGVPNGEPSLSIVPPIDDFYPEAPMTIPEDSIQMKESCGEQSHKENTSEGIKEKAAPIVDLRELKALNKLDQLQYLDQLDELKELSQLSQLKNLKQLDKLNNLFDLEKLSKLDQLENLHSLIYLKKLDSLNKLDKIDDLKMLNNLSDLEQMLELYGDQLQNVKYLSQLENLKNLTNLTELKHLEQIKELSKLHNLDSLVNLQELQNLESLSKLTNLKKLDQLETLDKLDNLQELSKLDQLQRMDELKKLDKLDDEKILTYLGKLDQLSILKEKGSKFVLKMAFASVLDFLKVALMAALMVYMVGKNTESQTISRILPYLGFGEGEKVNLGLSLLEREVGAKDFERYYQNLLVRVQNEMDAFYDALDFKPSIYRYKILSDLYSYQYQSAQYNLSAVVKKGMGDKMEHFKKRYSEVYEFDREAKFTETGSPSQEALVSANIFFKQGKYLEALNHFAKVTDRQNLSSVAYGEMVAFHMAYLTDAQALKNYLGTLQDGEKVP
ncbi:MAG: hypothetical protein ACOYL6_08145 [Bacteriovoracaceae bacterium]